MDKLLDAFGIDWKLLVVQAVNFGILIIALWYLLYKPVMKVLAERQAKIAQGVEDAEKATAKLATADAEASARVQTAETEAEKLLAHAREEGQTERARIVKEAEMRAESVEKDAQMRADESASRALRESEKEIARLAVLAAGRVMGEK